MPHDVGEEDKTKNRFIRIKQGINTRIVPAIEQNGYQEHTKQKNTKYYQIIYLQLNAIFFSLT